MTNDDDMPVSWNDDYAHWHTCIDCGMRYLCDVSDHPVHEGQSLDLDGCEECSMRGSRGRDSSWKRKRIRFF